MATNPTATLPHRVLRSLDRSWNYARWETLPFDGNRYEVLGGAPDITR